MIEGIEIICLALGTLCFYALCAAFVVFVLFSIVLVFYFHDIDIDEIARQFPKKKNKNND